MKNLKDNNSLVALLSSVVITSVLGLILFLTTSVSSVPENGSVEFVELEIRIGLNGGVSPMTFSTDHSWIDDLKFKSTTEMFNHMSSQGWILDQIYPSENKRGFNGNAYLFKKSTP